MNIGDIFFWVGITLVVIGFVRCERTITHLQKRVKFLNDFIGEQEYQRLIKHQDSYLEQQEADNDKT